MTALGASIIVPEAISAMAEIASQFVEMDDLQRAASTVVARLTGGEAGFITACCASGITMAVAGAMTGDDLLAIERLPDDTAGLKTEVVIQLGHIVNYGAPIDQSIRLAGAKVVPAGTVSVTQDYHLAKRSTSARRRRSTSSPTTPCSTACCRWRSSARSATPRACR